MRTTRPPGRYQTHISYTVVREAVPANREVLDRPELAAAWARSVIPDDDREHFVIACLDSQNRLNYTHNISTGTLSASIVHPREVFRVAIMAGAAHIIIAHNHPSGDPTPSKEDVHLTQQLAAGATLLGIRIHDHVIVGSGSDSFVSFSQRGLL